jgi:hypothetical protein
MTTISLHLLLNFKVLFFGNLRSLVSQCQILFLVKRDPVFNLFISLISHLLHHIILDLDLLEKLLVVFSVLAVINVMEMKVAHDESEFFKVVDLVLTNAFDG